MMTAGDDTDVQRGPYITADAMFVSLPLEFDTYGGYP